MKETAAAPSRGQVEDNGYMVTASGLAEEISGFTFWVARSLNDVLVRVVTHLFHILSFSWPSVGSSNSQWCWIGFLGHGPNFLHSRGYGFSLEVGGLSGLVVEGYSRCLCPLRPWGRLFFFRWPLLGVLPLCY